MRKQLWCCCFRLKSVPGSKSGHKTGSNTFKMKIGRLLVMRHNIAAICSVRDLIYNQMEAFRWGRFDGGVSIEALRSW